MKFRVIFIFVVLIQFSKTQEQSFDDLESELAAVSQYKPNEVKRAKRTLTTICVEIKPSSPYEEPYFMCKGTDVPQASKGGAYSGDGNQHLYSSKITFKPKPSSYGQSESYHPIVNNDYHNPGKIEQPKHTKYETLAEYGSDYAKPSKTTYEKKPYSDHQESYNGQASYESQKALHGVKLYTNSQLEQIKTPIHKITYTKPLKIEAYGHENIAPEYSKPSSHDYGHIDAKSPYKEVSNSKTSYGQSSPSYTTHPESKGTYSNSYSAKPTYDHSDEVYTPSKPHSEQYSKTNLKPVHENPGSHSSAMYSTNDYTKPEKGYDQASSKPGYSFHHQAYRGMSDDFMQPMWDMNAQNMQDENFGYRSMNNPMEWSEPQLPHSNHQQQHFASLERPVKTDFSANDRSVPQAPMPSPHGYAPPAFYGQDEPAVSSAPYVQAPRPSPASLSVAQPYSSGVPSYPAMYLPSYDSALPSYVPSILPYEAGPLVPTYVNPHQIVKPLCPQAYLYSWQPAVIPLPCFSPQTTYNQQLGASVNTNQQQNHATSRSEENTTTAKTSENNSTSTESKDDKTNLSLKNDTIVSTNSTEAVKSSEQVDEKVADKKPDNQDAESEQQPKDDQATVAASKESTESNTKVAYQSMMRMAHLAAKMNNHDDPIDEKYLPPLNLEKKMKF